MNNVSKPLNHMIKDYNELAYRNAGWPMISSNAPFRTSSASPEFIGPMDIKTACFTIEDMPAGGEF
jgi:hypothetical protein